MADLTTGFDHSSVVCILARLIVVSPQQTQGQWYAVVEAGVCGSLAVLLARRHVVLRRQAGSRESLLDAGGWHRELCEALGEDPGPHEPQVDATRCLEELDGGGETKFPESGSNVAFPRIPEVSVGKRCAKNARQRRCSEVSSFHRYRTRQTFKTTNVHG